MQDTHPEKQGQSAKGPGDKGVQTGEKTSKTKRKDLKD